MASVTAEADLGAVGEVEAGGVRAREAEVGRGEASGAAGEAEERVGKDEAGGARREGEAGADEPWGVRAAGAGPGGAEAEEERFGRGRECADAVAEDEDVRCDRRTRGLSRGFWPPGAILGRRLGVKRWYGGMAALGARGVA